MPEVKVLTIPGAGTKLSIGRWFRRVGDRVTVPRELPWNYLAILMMCGFADLFSDWRVVIDLYLGRRIFRSCLDGICWCPRRRTRRIGALALSCFRTETRPSISS